MIDEVLLKESDTAQDDVETIWFLKQLICVKHYRRNLKTAVRKR